MSPHPPRVLSEFIVLREIFVVDFEMNQSLFNRVYFEEICTLESSGDYILWNLQAVNYRISCGMVLREERRGDISSPLSVGPLPVEIKSTGAFVMPSRRIPPVE